MFLHVDDGLLLGTSWTVQWVIEQLARQIMTRIVGKLQKLDDQFVLGWMVMTARGHTAEANPKYIRDLNAVLGLEDFNSFATQSVKRTLC